MIYDDTCDLFDWFDVTAHWREGWRPVRDQWRDINGHDHDDILFRSPLGSYVRARGSEHGEELAFERLRAVLFQVGNIDPESEAYEHGYADAVAGKQVVYDDRGYQGDMTAYGNYATGFSFGLKDNMDGRVPQR